MTVTVPTTDWDCAKAWSAQRAEAARLSDLLSRVYDAEIGLIRFIAEIPCQPDEPPLHLAVAEHQNPFLVPPRSLDVDGAPLPAGSMMGTGAALDRVSALWSTVGETIERYALHVYDRDLITLARPDELDGLCVTPDRMILFDERQYDRPDFRFVRYDPAQRIGWTQGIDLRTGEHVYLPAVLSYLAYRIVAPAERLDSGYSTGAAAGPSLEAAYHSGLLEVIERDSFACHWYLRRTPPEIDIAEYAGQLSARLVSIVAEARLRLRFFDITTDLGVPTVLAVGLPKAGGVAIGASARPSFAAAIEKAAIEAFHTFNWISELRRDRASIDHLADIRSYRDHVIWYLDPSRLEALDFILNGSRPDRLPATGWGGSTDGARLATLVARLAGAGYASYGLDLTPEEVDGLGLWVARSFVPGLHPLGSGTGNEHGDTRRLRRFAHAVGLPTPITVNLDPHPFP